MANLLVEHEGALSFITLNRPERRNALSFEVLEELLATLKALPAESRAVILRANGPAFSAGHDISEMAGKDGAYYQKLFALCTDVMEAVQAIPQPVIAQVHALATAAGCQLVASCDLVVASTEARFATPGVKIGLFCSTPMVALSRAVPAKKALEMLLTGEPLSAQDALAAGLVNRVVAPAELAQAARALAEKIATSSSYVVGIGKRAFYQQLRLPQPLAYDYAQDVMVMNASAQDAQEGMNAFLQKRPPKWCGR